jgi:hypothetical protein
VAQGEADQAAVGQLTKAAKRVAKRGWPLVVAPESRPAASRITLTEHLRKIAGEQRLDNTHIYAHGRRDTFAVMLVHHGTP